MLAPCFKSASELGIDEDQRIALIHVLGQMERGELWEIPHSEVPPLESISAIGLRDPHAFSMRCWTTCICGHASRHAAFDGGLITSCGPFGKLFYNSGLSMEQAMLKLRDFLCGVNLDA